MLCCLWYSIGLGVRGLWVGMFDAFWVLLGVVVLRFPLCVCVYARVCMCVRA
jgi:hypothetical protein